MNITEISSNSQIQLVLNKADLKELFQGKKVRIFYK